MDRGIMVPTDDGDAYGEYDGDTSLAKTGPWEHTEPEDRSPYFEKGENPARDINVPQRDEYGRKVSRFTRTAAESRALMTSRPLSLMKAYGTVHLATMSLQTRMPSTGPMTRWKDSTMTRS